MSSPRVGGSDKLNIAFEINGLMSLLNREVGTGHRALDKISTILGMPGMHKKTPQRHDKQLREVEVKEAAEVTDRAASAVREAYMETGEDLRERCAAGETPIMDISGSFDGSWQKRGFTSLCGVAACIEILTGLVVDYHVMSTYCHACKLEEAKGLSETEMKAWREGHAEECCQNFEGTSKAMEVEAAKVLWGRSMEKHKFRYTQVLCDEESAVSAVLRELSPYGDVQVEKLECLNHASKRLGTALRKLAKEERLGGKGRGKLTGEKCDALQKYHHKAIMCRENQLDVEKMRASIWAAFFHSISSDDSSYHHRCPEGENSCCFVQKALARGKDPPPHSDHASKTFLCYEVAEKVRDVYERMTNANLLTRMRHGKTQNANESLHSIIWLRCSKTTLVGKKKIDSAVARAVSAFSEGAQSLVKVMGKLWVETSIITLQNLRETDTLRMQRGDAQCQEGACLKRKEVAEERKKDTRKKGRKEGKKYGRGDF